MEIGAKNPQRTSKVGLAALASTSHLDPTIVTFYPFALLLLLLLLLLVLWIIHRDFSHSHRLVLSTPPWTPYSGQTTPKCGGKRPWAVLGLGSRQYRQYPTSPLASLSLLPVSALYLRVALSVSRFQVAQIAFSLLALAASVWLIRRVRNAENEAPRIYTVPKPKTPDTYQTVEEASIKVSSVFLLLPSFSF